MDGYQSVEKPKVETPIDQSEIRMTSQGRKRSYSTYGMSLLQQAVEGPITKPESGIIMSNALPWENSFGFQSVPNEYMDQLIGFEGTANLTERNMSVVGIDGSNAKKKVIDEQFENDSPAISSISYSMEDPERGVDYGRIRKVVNEVNGPDNGLPSTEHPLAMSMNLADTRGSAFVSMKQPYDREGGHVTLMGNSYDIGDANIRPVSSTFGQGVNHAVTTTHAVRTTHAHKKGDSNAIFFGSYQDVMDALSRPVSSYTLLYEQHSVSTSETPRRKEVDVQNGNATLSTSKARKSRLESTYKNKSEKKAATKEAPHRFPTNVKSLTVTGMLDGVAVRYISASREKELRGIIKGASYLCGCQSCNYSKTLNAYEFEHHAGCKTSHPNNHIRFENGKSIHQIVQELKSTPESMLFDAILTVTGSPINQKAFCAWKESYQAASRKLPRISGKEQLHL